MEKYCITLRCSFSGSVCVKADMGTGTWFWWFMFVCDLLIPALMILAGRMMWKHAPKNINAIIGYRTKRSMKNIETWNFANNHSGRLWWKIGWIMLPLSAIVLFPFYYSSDDTIAVAGAILSFLQCAILLLSIYPTERALKGTFTDEGKRR